MITIERFWRLSQETLSIEQQLQLLDEALAVGQPNDDTLAELLQTLKLKYAQASEGERSTLALRMAPLLAHCCTIDPAWSLTLLQSVFNRRGPYHRSVALLAVERFASVILKLAGKEIVVEVWKEIKAVESMLFHDLEQAPQ